MGRRGWERLAILAVCAIAGAGPARAGFPSDVPDRFQILLGGVRAEFNTQASLALTGAPGAYVSLEDVFDLPVAQSDWSVEGFWRFSRKGYLDFGYVDFRRKAATIIDQDVSWGGYTLQRDSRVDAKFSSAFPYAAYRHDFLHLQQIHLSGSAGISYLRLGTGLSTEAVVLDPDGNPVSGQFEKDVSLAFPVPLLGIEMDWRLARRTVLQFYQRLFFVDYQGLKGSLQFGALRYQWFVTPHVAIGAGFVTDRIGIGEYQKGDYTARFQYGVMGLEYFAKLAF
jgi:hypothetical protein